MKLVSSAFFYRVSLIGKCWHQDPAQRPKPSEIIETLLENRELVNACVGVPATTILDDSMANFDAREANMHTSRILMGISFRLVL